MLGSGLAIEYELIDNLKPWPNNPRQHTEEQLADLMAIITHVGWNDPIGVQADTNRIVEGHGRWEAAKRLGLAQVPIVRLPLTNKEAQLYVVAHNAIGTRSTWDYSTLSGMLKEWNKDQLQLNLTGLSEPEIEPLLQTAFLPAATDDEAPKRPKDVTTVIFSDDQFFQVERAVGKVAAIIGGDPLSKAQVLAWLCEAYCGAADVREMLEL